MATGHQSPQSSLPPLSQKQVNTTTWGAGGNTSTITDEYIHPNSFVLVQVVGTVSQAGQWSYSHNQGNVVITSSDSETSSLPIRYIVI